LCPAGGPPAGTGLATLRLLIPTPLAEKLAESLLIAPAAAIAASLIACDIVPVADATIDGAMDGAMMAAAERARTGGRDVIFWRPGMVAADGALAVIRDRRDAGVGCLYVAVFPLSATAIDPDSNDDGNGVLTLAPQQLAALVAKAPRFSAPGAGTACWREGPGPTTVLVSLTLHPVFVDTRTLISAVGASPAGPPAIEIPTRFAADRDGDGTGNTVGYIEDSHQFCCVDIAADCADAEADDSGDDAERQAGALIAFAARRLFGRPGFTRHLAHLDHPVFYHADAVPAPPSTAAATRLARQVCTAVTDTAARCHTPPHPGWGWLTAPGGMPPLPPAQPPAAAEAPRFHHVMVVWGATYTDLFLRACLPTLLSPGNIPALAGNGGSTFNIYTTDADAVRMDGHPAIARLRRYIAVRFHVIDRHGEARLFTDNRYDMATAFHRHAYGLALAEDAVLVFFCPDILLADGSISALERRIAAGYDTVLVSGPRMALESVEPWLKTRFTDDGGLTLSADELVRIGLRSLHPQSRGSLWGSRQFNSDWPSQLFWPDGDDLLVAHCWQLHPMAIRPRRRSTVFHQTIDGDFLARAIRDGQRVHIVQDSREFCVLELSRLDHGGIADHRLDVFDPARFRQWAAGSLLAVNRQFVRYPIVYHDGDIAPQRLSVALNRAAAVVGGLLRQTDDILPAQPGLYHADDFRDATGRRFIYGAGAAGRAVATALQAQGVAVTGFIDTRRGGTVDDLPLLTAGQYAADAQTGDLIAIVSQYRAEIVEHLAGLPLDGVSIADGYPYYQMLTTPPPPRLDIRGWQPDAPRPHFSGGSAGAARLFVNSIPKSGTHMLSRLLDLLGLRLKPGMTLNSWDAEYHPGGVRFGPDGVIIAKAGEVPLAGTMCGFSTVDAFATMMARKFGDTVLPYYGYGHHLWSAESADYFHRHKIKMLLIVRDPRAIAVSHAHWVLDPRVKHGLCDVYAGMDMGERLRCEFFGYPRSGPGAYGKLIPLVQRFRNVRRWATAANAATGDSTGDAGVHITTFESLIGPAGGGDAADQAAEFDRICAFIGLDNPPDLGWINDRLRGDTATFRLGTIDGWRRHEADIPAEAAADIDEMLDILNQLRAGKDRQRFVR
jgi:hypothetical protein